jgi:hypothetical protein
MSIPGASIMNEKTPIYWLNGIQSTKEMTLEDLIEIENWLTDKNDDEKYILQCVCEKVVDQVEKPDYIPFIAIRVTEQAFKNRKYVDLLNTKQTFFNIFSINDCEIKCSVPSNIPKSVMPDLDCFNIKLSKSSNLEQEEEKDE